MALTRLTNWNDGDVLTSAALEAEFDNIYNNGLALVSPWTTDMQAGGFLLAGLGLGAVSGPALQFTGDSNTGMYSSGADTVAFAAGGIRVLSVGLEPSVAFAHIRSTDTGAQGPVLSLEHDSVSPADSDIGATIRIMANDDGASARAIGLISFVFDDVTATTMDSSILFAVMDNVNAGNAATVASLSSLGVWTDASGRAGKEYIGDVTDVIGKLGALTTLGVYHSKDLPVDKRGGAEKHYSPTAEDFYSVFGLGRDPAKGVPGIASKDIACLAIKGLLELDGRVKLLEAKP